MKELVKQLQVKANMIQMGERIAWGSDTDLMLQAADKIEELEVLLLAIKNDLLERSEKDSKGGKVVNLSNGLWHKLNKTIK